MTITNNSCFYISIKINLLIVFLRRGDFIRYTSKSTRSKLCLRFVFVESVMPVTHGAPPYCTPIEINNKITCYWIFVFLLKIVTEQWNAIGNHFKKIIGVGYWGRGCQILKFLKNSSQWKSWYNNFLQIFIIIDKCPIPPQRTMSIHVH